MILFKLAWAFPHLHLRLLFKLCKTSCIVSSPLMWTMFHPPLCSNQRALHALCSAYTSQRQEPVPTAAASRPPPDPQQPRHTSKDIELSATNFSSRLGDASQRPSQTSYREQDLQQQRRGREQMMQPSLSNAESFGESPGMRQPA